MRVGVSGKVLHKSYLSRSRNVHSGVGRTLRVNSSEVRSLPCYIIQVVTNTLPRTRHSMVYAVIIIYITIVRMIYALSSWKYTRKKWELVIRFNFETSITTIISVQDTFLTDRIVFYCAKNFNCDPQADGNKVNNLSQDNIDRTCIDLLVADRSLM